MPSRPSVPCAITQYELCCALGMDRNEVRDALLEDRTGLHATDGNAAFARMPVTYVGAVDTPLPGLAAEHAVYDTRVARLFSWTFERMRTSVRAACERWGEARVAIVIGGSTGGLDVTEQAFRDQLQHGAMPARYSLTQSHDMHAVVELARRLTHARGPGIVVSTACSSSGKALGSAQRLIAAGLADAVLVGGVDALCETTVGGFNSLSILSTQPCRPFGQARDGINIGEGAALFLLEREGDAATQLLSVGESNDAHHMTAPHPEGLGAEHAMREALARADLDATLIDHVNAHGTGTPHNDIAESLAIARVLGTDVSTTSTKGYTGHALGAAGAIEAAISLLCIEHGFVPACLGATPMDPAIGIHIARTTSAQRVRHVLSNSFAFGGSNVSVLLGART